MKSFKPDTVLVTLDQGCGPDLCPVPVMARSTGRLISPCHPFWPLIGAPTQRKSRDIAGYRHLTVPSLLPVCERALIGFADTNESFRVPRQNVQGAFHSLETERFTK